MEIKKFLNTDYFTTREELVNLTGLSDRVIRDKISQLKKVHPVIYNSQTKGYRLAKDFSKIGYDELKNELDLIQHSINDMESRKDNFNHQERAYIAYLIKGKERMKMLANLENGVMQLIDLNYIEETLKDIDNKKNMINHFLSLDKENIEVIVEVAKDGVRCKLKKIQKEGVSCKS